jgi:hypothetical protein
MVITGTLDLGDGLEGRIEGHIESALTHVANRGAYSA